MPVHQSLITCGPIDRCRDSRADVVVWLVLAASVALKLHHLNHTALTHWDEAFHAIVAHNIVKHPFKPTLVDVPYRPFTHESWTENHIWLHKPILPLWMLALSFAALGATPFALRLPSVILSTGAAWLTYLIGRDLVGRPAGAFAATLQALNPFLLGLIHGYQFADHIDIALLFYVELGMYCLTRSLRNGSRRDVLFSGIAQGLAFLCKSYLAFIVFGVAAVAWLVCLVGRRPQWTMNAARLLLLMSATAVVALPWMTYCLLVYPDEFVYEQLHIWKHVHGNVENWAGPWQRVAFDYLIRIYQSWYIPVGVAAIVLAGRLRRHDSQLWILYAWLLGILVPHLIVTTKTPSATVLAVPAALLLLGRIVSEAWRCKVSALAALGCALLTTIVMPAVGYPIHLSPTADGAAAVARHGWTVVLQIAGVLAIAAIVKALSPQWPFRGRVTRYCKYAAGACCLVALSWIIGLTVERAYATTERNANDPASVEIGLFAREHLPANAVLLCDERQGCDHLTMMFYSDRTCYALDWGNVDDTARQVVEHGGYPYLVSSHRLHLAAVFASRIGGTTVYRYMPDRSGGAPGSRRSD